jgi:hypothetical protein
MSTATRALVTADPRVVAFTPTSPGDLLRFDGTWLFDGLVRFGAVSVIPVSGSRPLTTVDARTRSFG